MPAFGEKKVKSLLPIDCKILLDNVVSAGKGKTAEQIRTLLNVVFKGAIAHALIERNPLDTVLYIKHVRKTGSALTVAEEIEIYPKLLNHEYGKFIAIYLFTGIRPNELYKSSVEPPFLVAQNSKRKNGRIEFKKIPISTVLFSFVVDGLGEIPSLKVLRAYFKTLLPNHTLKDLRKTFNTRCKEFGLSDHARKYFMGHALGAVDGTYTELSDEYLLKQAERLSEWGARFPKNSPKS